MSADRPARSLGSAVAELRARAGTQSDPDVVAALLDVLGVSVEEAAAQASVSPPAPAPGAQAA